MEAKHEPGPLKWHPQNDLQLGEFTLQMAGEGSAPKTMFLETSKCGPFQGPKKRNTKSPEFCLRLEVQGAVLVQVVLDEALLLLMSCSQWSLGQSIPIESQGIAGATHKVKKSPNRRMSGFPGAMNKTWKPQRETKLSEYYSRTWFCMAWKQRLEFPPRGLPRERKGTFFATRF